MTEIVTSEMNNETKKLNVVVDEYAHLYTFEWFFKEQEKKRKSQGYSKEEIIEIVKEVLKEERDKSMKDVVTRETMEKEINKMTGEINKMTGETKQMIEEKSK